MVLNLLGNIVVKSISTCMFIQLIMNNYNLEETNVVFGYLKVLRKEKKGIKVMFSSYKFLRENISERK